MTSIIWGAFGLTLILIVAVGAIIQYTKDKEKYTKTEAAEAWNGMMGEVKPSAHVAKTHLISEPVTSFIKCFKDNPKRFKLSRTDSWGWWRLRDSVTKKEWIFTASKVTGILSWYHSVHLEGEGYDWLTDDEKSALYLAMYPYFVTERRDRLHTIQRERLTRIYKEEGNV